MKSILIAILVIVSIVLGLIAFSNSRMYVPDPIRDGKIHIEIIQQNALRGNLASSEDVKEAANSFLSLSNITVLDCVFKPASGGRVATMIITYIAW